MRLHFWSGIATSLALCLAVASCGPAARATPTRSIDPSTLYVAQVHWSPSEITALGVTPGFPRDSWVALVGGDGYVRHGRVGGQSRHECDDCVGPRMAIVLSIDQPPSTTFAIGPADRRLPRISLVSEAPFEAGSDQWIATSTFDIDADGTADLERVERCMDSVTTGCDQPACTRRCSATRTFGETGVRGELCAAQTVVRVACLPQAPAVAQSTSEETTRDETTDETEQATEDDDEVVHGSGMQRPDRPAPERRHWGSRRRPR